MRRGAPLLAALAVAAPLAAGAVGCATTTTTTRQVPVAHVPLPAGALQSLVVQPGEAPAGAVPLLRATGPASAAMIASYAADPATARQQLTARGFVAGYVVEYADTTAGTSLVVTVVQFAAVAGAQQQVAADLTAALPAGASRPAVAPVGDQSGAVLQPVPGGAAGSQLATVRFRVGRLDYLVAAAGPGAVDPASVDTIARTLAGRAVASPASR